MFKMPIGNNSISSYQQHLRLVHHNHQRQPTRINCHQKQLHQPDIATKTGGNGANSASKLNKDTTSHITSTNSSIADSNNNNTDGGGSNNSGNQGLSRLKSSTISKVPSAKSRLKQPVASLSTNSNNSSSTTASATIAQPVITSEKGINERIQRNRTPASKPTTAAPSPAGRLLPAKATDTGLVRARPTSLPLGKSPPKRLSDAPRLYTSILPKLTAANQLLEIPNGDHNIVSGKKKFPSTRQQLSHLACESKQCHNNNAVAASQRVQSQPADKRKYATKQTANSASGLESRLSGLKNLVAVVRPQHTTTVTSTSSSSSAYSSASTKAIIARTTNSIGYPKLNNLMTTSTGTLNAKSESGKVNLTHKVVNGCKVEKERDGSKQDEVVSLDVIACTTGESAGVGASVGESGGPNSGTSDYSSPSSQRSSRSLTLWKQPASSSLKSGQFVQSTNTAALTKKPPSDNSRANDGHSCDKKPSGNVKQQQQNAGQQEQRFPANRKRPLLGQSSPSVVPADALQITTNQQIANNCYNHHVDDDDYDHHSECPGPAGGDVAITDDGPKQTNVTNSTTIQLKETITNNLGVHAISDHIKPKPMGQQVLSLMMLDVGLVPADASNHPGENYDQLNSCHSGSHVRVQNREQATNGDGVNSRFINNCSSCPDHDDSDAADTLNKRCCSTDSISANHNHARCMLEHRKYHDQSKNCEPPQPVHETLSLQVRFSNDRYNDNSKSVSLPCSPRSKLHGDRTYKRVNRNCFNYRGVARPIGMAVCNQTDYKANRTFDRRERLQKANEASTNSCDGNRSHPTASSKDLQRFCDNMFEDSHSLASSSCSSLNNCPPLLTLSNQLNGFKFGELLKGQQIAGQMLQDEKKDQYNNQKVSPGFQSPVKREQLKTQSPDQVARHPIVFASNKGSYNCGNDSTESELEVQISRKIDHVDACTFTTAAASFNTKRIEAASASHRALDGSCEEQAASMMLMENVFEKSSQAQSDRLYLDGDQHSRDARLRLQMQQQNIEQIARRQPQQRSNSIGAQEFHSNGIYQRLKYSVCTPGNYFHDDTLMQNQLNRSQHIPSPFHQHHRPQPGRTSSPIGAGTHHHTRNQLHASLECLSSPYSDYQQQKLQQQHHQYHQQQHFQPQTQQQQIRANQHYAASYVLAAPPTNTVYNQSSDQDLAAAVIGGPSQYHSLGHALQRDGGNSNSEGNYNIAGQQSQNLISRALAQVTQSPLRRMTSGGLSATASSQNPLGQTSNVPFPIRGGHSSISLASSSYMLEDKFQIEIRKLQSELKNEKEKNEALNSQLNINSSLMAAFEQSLTTLNTRLRQLTALNEKRDNEIAELKQELLTSQLNLDRSTTEKSGGDEDDEGHARLTPKNCDNLNDSEQNLLKTIEDLKRQLLEKDRLLTDTRLEALSAAHQLEQLESKLNGENSLVLHEEDLDEGVVNHSPSESDATTDSAHFSEMNNQFIKSHQPSINEVLNSTDTKSS